MKFYWIMPGGLKEAYRRELEIYESELLKGNLQAAWRQLERAHIIGQSWPKEHCYIHWLMLKFGVKIKNRKEIAGQVPRLIFGGIKSFVGIIPVGNTGGADVACLLPMTIPEDLQKMIRPYKDI